MKKTIAAAAEFIINFAKTEKFKRFVKCELIVAAIVVTLVFGFKAYTDYNWDRQVEDAYAKVDKETIDKGVSDLVQVTNEYLDYRREAVMSLVDLICKNYYIYIDVLERKDINNAEDYLRNLEAYNPTEEISSVVYAAFEIRKNPEVVEYIDKVINGEEQL